ncbi:hypothetical protein LBMAG53_17530 [Planctomycetota bacterium]|nr:hypothetical protein LBMAG53_17530 [Planctomycetota bacterium]
MNAQPGIKKESVDMRRELILLAYLASASFTLMAADALPLGKLPPPKLDYSKPIQFDVQFSPVVFPQDTPKEVRGNPLPAIIGGYLEGGKVTGAYAPDISHIYHAGASPDQFEWDLCPYGPRHGTGSRDAQREKFTSSTLRMTDAQVEGTWRFNYISTKDSGKTTSPVYEISIQATATSCGYAGTYTGKIADVPVSGDCVLAAHNIPAGVIDPANAIYQILGGNYAVLVEVQAGKAVQAWAVAGVVSAERTWRYRYPGDAVAATFLFPADASGMSLKITDEGLDGKAVTLGGQITITPEPKTASRMFGPTTLDLSGTVISGAGKIRGNGKESKVEQARSYPLTDPLMARSLALLKETHRGSKPTAPELLAQADQESLRTDVQPGPSEQTRYMQRLWNGGTSGEYNYHRSYIYAPWLDLEVVPSAVRYRFDLIDASHENTGIRPLIDFFEASSPRVSLLPIWAKVPKNLGRNPISSLRVTAFDADGKALGKPQECGITRRPAFSQDQIVTPDPKVLMELAMRQPYHLTTRYYSHLYLTEAVLAAKNGVKPLSYESPHHHLPQTLMVEHEDNPVQRDQYMRLLNTYVDRRMKEQNEPYFKLPYHYNVGLNGVVQETGRNFLNVLDLQPNTELLDRMRLWTRFFSRMQQPSGSWTISYRGMLGCTGGYSLGGSFFLDQPSTPWLPFLARMRQHDNDPTFRAMERAIEEKAASWVLNNTLRTGFSENVQQQTLSNDNGHTVPNQIEYVLYVLRHAPPVQRDVVMATDLMRRIEDLFISWEAHAKTRGGNFTFERSLYPIEALCFLELYALTGDPLMRAKSEALVSTYLQDSDPWNGSNGLSGLTSKMNYDRFIQETDDPDWIVRWVHRDRELRATPPSAAPEQHLTVTLDQLIDGIDRVVLDLALADGRVTQALARTPTWDGPGINFYQPGTVHTRPGKAFFHSVDASGLKLSAEGLSGTVKLTLKPPQSDTLISMIAEISAKRHALRGWRGTWKQDNNQGRVEGVTLVDAVVKGPQQIFVKVNDALSGGEAWQNWTLAGAVLPSTGSATGATLINPNAGWTAQATGLKDCILNGDTFTMSMDGEVTWHGVAERIPKDETQTTYTYKTTPESNQALLAHWELSINKNNSSLYCPFLKPGTGDLSADGKLIYQTDSKPVTPGKYRLKLDGKRLGNILFGMATITGPDGRESVRQFLGDVESIGKP